MKRWNKKFWIPVVSLVVVLLLVSVAFFIQGFRPLDLESSKKLSFNFGFLTGKSDSKSPEDLSDEEKKHNDKKLEDAKKEEESDDEDGGGTTGQCKWPDAVLTSKSGNDLSVVVDKGHCLPSTYAPSDLVDIGQSGIRKTKSEHLVRSVIISDLTAMVSAIKAAGMDISALSCYRSYSTQVRVYNNSVASIGQTQTDKVSARPGHSEHQLGTTCDFASKENGDALSVSFGNTKVYKWLLSNAGEYGFRLSYPEGQSGSTGYSYEPWHWRYVGK